MQLVPRTVITEIVAYRDAALAKMREAITAMGQGATLAEEAEVLAKQAHNGVHFIHKIRTNTDTYARIFSPIREGESLELYRQNLDAKVWMHLLSRTGMEKMMDKEALDKFYDDLCGSVPEVTEDSIRATLEGLALDAKLIFQRGLANSFINLDRRFRSHDAFKLGSRVILTHVFDGYGMWNYHSRMRETITDLERVFKVLDGHPENIGALVTEIEKDRSQFRGFSARQSYTESTYFRIRCFQNGNAHLWFTRDDLVEKANLMLAEYYGEVLPDAVPDDVAGEDLKSYALSKDLAFYPTPDPVARKMLDSIYLQPEDLVLEPSAGSGNIVRHILKKGVRVHAIEVDSERVRMLRAIDPVRVTVQEANFLQVRPEPIYSYVLMNPPFEGTHWMAHVRHAFDFLKPNGVLVAVLPVSAELGDSSKHEAFRKWAMQNSRYDKINFTELPRESFASSGTKVNTVLLTLHR